MLKGFSEDFKKKCVQRQPQVELISNLLDSDSDMIIYGVSGSGKTTLIRDLLHEKKINYVKINCIQCQTKKTVIQDLISSLEAKFNYKLKQTTKTSQLIHKINQLHEFNMQKVLNQDTDQYFSFEDDHFYIWFDNIEKLSITPKFFSQLISIKTILKINFCVIFSGVAFQDQVILENSDIDLLPSITLQPIDTKNLIYVIKINLKNKLLAQEQKCFEVFGDKFINETVQTFLIIVKNATTISSICLKLFKLLISDFSRKDNPQDKDYAFLVKNENFVNAKRLIFQDPYLNEGDSKEFMEKIKNSKSTRVDSFSLIRYFLNIFSKQKFKFIFLKSPIQIAKLPFYSSIILLACWIGNRNPESTDKKLFKDYKGRQYKGKQEGALTHLKPIKFDRMIALAQSLISQSEFLRDYGVNTQNEINLYDQSIDFYSQIASLIEMKYIKIETTEASLTKVQYISTLDEQFVTSIALQYKIKLSDFLYKKE